VKSPQSLVVMGFAGFCENFGTGVVAEAVSAKHKPQVI
jgi:hypothetical protein